MRVGARQLYPLALTRADEHVAERLAIVGNAAQTLHPIAGQGFNLGLRDAASLAEVLADGRAQQCDEFDPGDGMRLERYREWRGADRSNIVRFTDGLVRLFAQPFGPIKVLRDLGMLAFDLMPAAKGALSQLSLGAAGRDSASGARRQSAAEMRPDFDIVIVGGGMVGACAAALAAADRELAELRIALAGGEAADVRRRAATSICAFPRCRADRSASSRRRCVAVVPPQFLSPYEDMIVWDASGKSARRRRDPLLRERDQRAESRHIVENRRIQWALYDCPPFRQRVTCCGRS